MKVKEKKLANNMSSIVKIDHQMYPLVPSLRYFSVSVKIFFSPPFEIFCPVLALTKVGSAGYDTTSAAVFHCIYYLYCHSNNLLSALKVWKEFEFKS